VAWLAWACRGDRVIGARVRDRMSGEEGTLRARLCVNATGPWAGDLLGPETAVPGLRLTRGTHLVLAGDPGGEARLFFSPEDGRVLFLLPFGAGRSLLGTTDLDEAEVSAEPAVRRDEVAYLGRAFRSQFPAWASWRPVGLQCGLRPLVDHPGNPSAVSREEHVEVDPASGVISILGGKFTTYRAVGERVLDRVEGLLGVPEGGHPSRFAPLAPAGKAGGEPEAVIRRAFAEESAITLDDLFFRRTRWGHGGPWEEHLAAAGEAWRRRFGLSPGAGAEVAEAFRETQRRRLAPLAGWPEP